MRRSAFGPERDLRECLRCYLEEHPEAADSLEGIRQWWLPDRLRDAVLDEDLEMAIAQLIASGEIQRNTLPDGS